MTKQSKPDEVVREYERMRALYADADESLLGLTDGLMIEAARMRVQLNRLNDIAAVTGLVKIDPDNPEHQKELPVSRMLSKLRPNYIACIQRIKSILNVQNDEDDDGLDEYE